MTRHNVLPENLYNFHEIGFLMGATHSEKVVVNVRELRLNGVLRSFGMYVISIIYFFYHTYIQIDGNREMAIVIEGICANGENLSPMIIFKAKEFRVGLFDPSLPFPKDILCGHSPNGWTNNEMGLGYLKHHFGPQSLSAEKAKGQYRMIVFDGHESHVSHEFLQYCIDNRIIAFCLPLHSTNHLQPLDVGIFGPYKNYYAQVLEKEFRYGRYGVSKANFWEFLSQARAKAFTIQNIKSAFATTGIHPLDRYIALRKVPAYDPIKHPDPKFMYDDQPISNSQKHTYILESPTTQILSESEATSIPENHTPERQIPKSQNTRSLLHTRKRRSNTPPLSAPSLNLPATPKTPNSLKQLTDDLFELASNPSLSPSKIRIHKTKLTKLIHSAQFAHAKIHLTEEARLQQKEEDRRRKARDQPCARKKIPTQGQAFATAEDLRRWRRDIVSDEYKKLQRKRVEQSKRRKNLQHQICELERKIEDKENNPRSRIRLSIDILQTKREEMYPKIISLTEKINLLDDKLAEFVREGLETTDHSDLGEYDEEPGECSESDDGIGVEHEVEQRGTDRMARLN